MPMGAMKVALCFSAARSRIANMSLIGQQERDGPAIGPDHTDHTLTVKSRTSR